MDGDDFDELIELLSNRQNMAMAEIDDADSEEQAMYFKGKDTGLAEAMVVLRRHVDVTRENVSDDVQASFERGSTKEKDY